MVWKKRKLSTRYISPYQISKRIEQVSYELELSPDLASIYPVFHVSKLKKCVGDPSLIIHIESVEVKGSLS